MAPSHRLAWGQHHPLGPPGRAGGVEDRRQRRRVRHRCGQAWSVHRAIRLHGRAHRRRQVFGGQRGEPRGLADQQRRAAIGQDMRHLRPPQRRIDRHMHQPRPRRRQRQDAGDPGLGQPARHPVAGPRARRQPGRERTDGIVQFAEAQRSRPVGQGGGIGRARAGRWSSGRAIGSRSVTSTLIARGRCRFHPRRLMRPQSFEYGTGRRTAWRRSRRPIKRCGRCWATLWACRRSGRRVRRGHAAVRRAARARLDGGGRRADRAGGPARHPDRG